MLASISSLFLLAGLSTALALPKPQSKNNVTDLVTRGGFGNGAIGIGEIIYELTHISHNAYDPDVQHSCVIQTWTSGGSQCGASIACDQAIGAGQYQPVTMLPGPGVSTDTWNVCYLNGRQYFTDPRVGDFSITYTKAGGVNSDRDGLHDPVLQFAHIGDWEAINAQQDADIAEDSGHLCHTWQTAGLEQIQYWCGVPQIGYGIFGITNTPTQYSDYTPGSCGIHWIEYQIPEGGSHYSFAGRIVDNDERLIGQIGDSYRVNGDQVDATNPVEINSSLPFPVVATIVTPGSLPDTDDAPVSFSYNGQTWDSDSAQCSTGGYDSGSRQGDCSFSC